MTRFGWVISTYASLLSVAVSTFFHPAPKLLWNATGSTPIGLYAIQPPEHLHIDDLVAVMPPDAIANFLSAGGYLPDGVPLLKHVLAIPGQTICREDSHILVDGIVMGDARDRDSLGRDLPIWSGCQKLQPGEIFVMNRNVPDSLDGRYFGALPASSVIGRAVPIWTISGNESSGGAPGSSR
jgi:conjugative transfer signal peptidase TraF